MAAAGITVCLTASLRRTVAWAGVVPVNSGDIDGLVTSSRGPEDGVWVIADTIDLPTKYVKIVVTENQGRYLVPDLPKANYKVLVRGYGLADSSGVKSNPGKTVNLIRWDFTPRAWTVESTTRRLAGRATGYDPHTPSGRLSTSKEAREQPVSGQISASS